MNFEVVVRHAVDIPPDQWRNLGLIVLLGGLFWLLGKKIERPK